MLDYFIFLGICILATSSPGPAVFLAIKNGAKYDLRTAMIGVFGNVLAMLTLASISALGLGAVLLASTTLYSILKIAGGLYLIFLGLRAWNSNATLNNVEKITHPIIPLKKSSLFRESYFVGLSNPKAIVFYTALFPQFINLSLPVFPQFILLSITFAICSFVFLMLYVSVANKLKIYLEKENILRWFNRVIGGVFVSFGVALILNRRA